jgi:hypothetical protein
VGFLDTILGRRKLEKPAPDRLFAMTTAYLTMTTELGLRSRGEAAIVFQALATADFAKLVADMVEVVEATGEESGTKVESRDDSYGYRWLVVEDDGFDDLVVALNAVSTALADGGYGERILAAVFAFEEEVTGRPVYFIYNYKRGAFYPFVPAEGSEQRDNEAELRLKAQLAKELPIEPELERWFPLWGAPI